MTLRCHQNNPNIKYCACHENKSGTAMSPNTVLNLPQELKRGHHRLFLSLALSFCDLFFVTVSFCGFPFCDHFLLCLFLSATVSFCGFAFPLLSSLFTFPFYLENKLLLISINFTPKTSHSCQKKWYTLFPRYLFVLSTSLCSAKNIPNSKPSQLNFL